MPPLPNLSTLFNKFAGREVPVIEKQVSVNIGGQTFDFDEVTLPKATPAVVKEMEKAAADNGLHLRLWLPGWAGTADYRTDRVNVHVEKGADGKYRISNRFDIG